ncbi:MAG: phosphatidate cytidylyltransferase, partial [Deltaproteobacteria bacterium]|nr:phosphatidate cytidylyltransferase [Deltaproteobacteria bacterium]
MSTRVRVKTAVVLLPVFLGVLFYGGAALFAALVAAAAAVGAHEYQSLACPDAAPWERRFVPLWAAVVVLSFLLPAAVPAEGVVLGLGCILYFWGLMRGEGPTPETLRRWGGALGAWVFVAYFLGQGVLVRSH